MPDLAFADIHSHVAPGVDDGPANGAESQTALAAMEAAGVTHLIATPHFSASVTLDADAREQRLSALDVGWTALESLARESGTAIAISRGAEILLDEPRPDLSDPRIRLAGGTFVLVEFPLGSIPPESPAVLAHIREMGWHPVLAHPERYAELRQRPHILAAWRGAGAYFQINAGSLLGSYGRMARLLAYDLLARGWVDMIASDYHGKGALPLPSAWSLLVGAGGGPQAECLMIVNPLRVLRDVPPLPVEGVRLRQGFLERARTLFVRRNMPDL